MWWVCSLVWYSVQSAVCDTTNHTDRDAVADRWQDSVRSCGEDVVCSYSAKAAKVKARGDFDFFDLEFFSNVEWRKRNVRLIWSLLCDMITRLQRIYGATRYPMADSIKYLVYLSARSAAGPVKAQCFFLLFFQLSAVVHPFFLNNRPITATTNTHTHTRILRLCTSTNWERTAIALTRQEVPMGGCRSISN